MSTVTKSRIRGEFTGCSGDTVYQFDNGQVWQQSRYKYRYKYKYRPAVTVRRESGRNLLYVDGMDEPIEVRRLA